MAEYDVVRYEGRLATHDVANDECFLVRFAARKDVAQVAALDQAATGVARSKFLNQLFEDPATTIHVAEDGGHIAGYLAARPGRAAMQIGPCIAPPASGVSLMGNAAKGRSGQRVFFDVPLYNAAAVACAEAMGLSAQRTFVRMRRGEVIGEDRTRLFASSGPELG